MQSYGLKHHSLIHSFIHTNISSHHAHTLTSQSSLETRVVVTSDLVSDIVSAVIVVVVPHVRSTDQGAGEDIGVRGISVVIIPGAGSPDVGGTGPEDYIAFIISVQLFYTVVHKKTIKIIPTLDKS